MGGIKIVRMRSFKKRENKDPARGREVAKERELVIPGFLLIPSLRL